MYINPFLKASAYVFEQLRLPCRIGKPSIKSSPLSGKDVVTIVGITGDIRGQMYFGGSISPVLEIVSAMMGGTVSSMDSIAQSAFSELSNMICGNAMSIFAREGISLDITPPALIQGQQIKVSAVKMNVLSIPIILNGSNEVEMNIVFQE